jgi:threonine dehydratase
VTDAEISQAMLLLLERGKTLVEPAGAATLAAILAGQVGGDDAPVAAVLSGGNIDPTLLSRLIVYGLSAAGRYLVVTIRMLDRPGELMRMLGVLTGLELNVIDVEHHRTGERLDVDEVDVRLVLETRDPDHRQAALDALTAAGYRADAP